MTTSARDSAARLFDLLRSEHAALGDFVAALAEFDRQRHWIDLGYASLFAFLQREPHVAREAWLRDGGRCQFPTADGGICGSTYQVELDHIEPKALGGPSTKENLRVACKPHNLGHARETYGDDWMDQFTANPRVPRARETVAPYSTNAYAAVPRFFGLRGARPRRRLR